MENTIREIKTTYQGTEITYAEDQDRWLFTLRGKDRSAESLANAKAAIDQPAPKDKKPFKRFRALLMDHHDDLVGVTVTSIAESLSWRGGKEVWIKKDKETKGGYSSSGREKVRKVSIDNLYKIDGHNTATKLAIKGKQKQVDVLEEQIDKLKQGLHKIDLKAEDYD